MIVGVLVELSNKNIDKEFFYLVPDELVSNIKVGIRVVVPFGTQKLEGFVLEIKNDKEIDIELKEIFSIVDSEVILSNELLKLGKVMQEKTLSTLISCYQVMLPKALKAKNGVIINKKYDIYYKLGNIPEHLSKGQEKIIKLFENKTVVSREEIVSISSSILRT